MTAFIYLEQEVIGGLIRCDHDQQAEVWAACHGLTPLDFYGEDSRQIYASIAAMMQEGGVCNIPLLEAHLSAMGKLQDVGGLAHLVIVANQSYALNPVSMAACVVKLKEASAKRQLLDLAHQIEAEIQDGRTVDDVAGMVSGELVRLVGKPKEKGGIFASAGELIAKPQPIAWLIKGIMEQNVTVMMFGKPGDGKSFLALSMACSIATGLDWYGHQVGRGTVAYIAGEGIPGIRRRVAAWCQAAGVSVGDGLYLSRRALLLPDEVGELIHHLKQMPNLRMVVLDTVQRTFSGDENSTRDATAYMRAADVIREAMQGVTVMMVHHSGHAEGRARGSIVFKASADVEMATSRSESGDLLLACTKAKEAEPFKPMAFQFQSVALHGWGDADNPVTSAVLHRLDAVPPTKAQDDWRKKISGSNQTKAMTILETMASASDTGWVKLDAWEKEAMQQTGIQKPSHFRRDLSTKLEEKGLIRTDSGHVCLLVGRFARGEIGGEAGRKGEKRGEIENQGMGNGGEKGRELYITPPFLPFPTPKNNSPLDAEYEEVMGL